MSMDHRAELAKIKRFDQLVRYLRDPMGWPIEGDDFEELTFEYSPEELGIDAKNAAKIQEIRRLRPLKADQPWGIFFVKFEPKRLPVVVLRRILGQVVLKKRASANKIERQAWAADDLLFISNYGEAEERKISFAHFSAPQERNDLPTLKVLGWDNRDTALHLDAVARELTQHLAWPENVTDTNAWRSRWRGAFTLQHREVITTSKDLSLRLAELARSIRDLTTATLGIENSRGPLRRLMKAFQESLLHDLDVDAFADMYAQTITYGLLSARLADPKKKTADDFAAHMRTNPFLRELMEHFLYIGGRKGKAGGAGIDFDELGVSEVVEMLDAAKIEAVIRDFGDKNRDEDPVIHFYEHFLSAYNRQLKIQRGVFYTPQSVVSYIVRSVHELLQNEFGLVDGLADTTTWGEMLKRHPGLKLPPLTDEHGDDRTISPDEPFVQVLDPATGTATFLVEVIEVIHQTLLAKWKKQRLTPAQQTAAWNEYVPAHLLPRIHGYELMMAPYAIAHMKIGLKLVETGYNFSSDVRAGIFLTNALEPWLPQLPLLGIAALAHEAIAVNEVKRGKRFTVIMGNPPYSNYGQLNKNQFIHGLLDDYKRNLDEKKLNLDDDFIKFTRFGQFVLQQSGLGIWGAVTSNTFFDGITHRRMRECLLESFNLCSIIDLHGSATKKEKSPDGTKDENVFEIKQGVGISIFARTPHPTCRALKFAELWGMRTVKYSQLAGGVRLNETAVEPISPNYFLVPKSVENAEEYASWINVTKIFIESGPGIKTERDNVAIQHTRPDMEAVIADFKSKTPEQLRKIYELGKDSRDWTIAGAKADVIENDNPQRIRRVLYRPFDLQWTWYSGKTRGFVGTPGSRIGFHMSRGPNLGFITSRTVYGTDPWRDALVTNTICEFGVMATRPGNTAPVFPLYRYEEPFSLSQHRSATAEKASLRPNFSAEFLATISQVLQLPQQGKDGLPAGIGPELIFHYAYAIFHSPRYRLRYGEFLKIDFPRLPLPGSIGLFRSLAQLGGKLVALHLLESAKVERPITELVGKLNCEIEKVTWSRDTVWVDKAQKNGFRGVPESVWNFHIGGYQVCEKWLKDRKGRVLSKEDVAHYQKIVVALSETIGLMENIDEVIDQHGGWPGAFQSVSIGATGP